ncbi:MAG TPA: thioredoxin family protein [Clostridia bacterium]|jgi:thioredoxin 1|nr:thioredoxin family protein [Clostridia bacterium]
MKDIVGIDSFKETVSNGIVFIKFTAVWCPQCKMMEPLIQQIEEQFSDKVIFVSIDTEKPDNIKIIKDLGIMTLPTYVVFKGGDQKEKFVGMKSKAAIISLLENLLN